MNKICPFCAEEIKMAATKCKYCGEFLIEEKNKIIINDANEPSELERWIGWKTGGVFSKLAIIIITAYGVWTLVYRVILGN